MSKENVVKFYDEAKKNAKLKAEFENLQNELQKTEQVKDFDSLAEKIVYIGKKYNFDFSKEELNSYLEDLKSNLTDEDLLNISGGRLSPKVAAIGMLGVLGISCIAGTAVKMSQFPSSTATQQEAVLSNENKADNGNKEAENEDKYDGKNKDNDALNSSISNNESNPMIAKARAPQPSHAPDANLLKTLLGNKRNDKVKNESPSLTVASQQKSTSAGTSSQKENSSPDVIVNKEEKTSQGIFDQDNTTLDAVQSMFLDAEAEMEAKTKAEAENIAKIKNVENKGSGWVYVSLKDGEDSFTISRGSLQYLANMTSMNVNDITHIWVNEGQVAPTLSNDIREIFSEPSDVQWRALGGVYQNAVKRFTEEETKAKETEEINKLMTAGSGYNEDQITRNLADLNVKSAKKDGSWLMLTLENKDKGVTVTKENLSTLARVAGFKNADEVQYIQVENGDVSPTLGANLQETFSEPGTIDGWVGHKYINTMHRLSADEIKNKKIQALVHSDVEEDLAKFIVEQNINVRNSDGTLNNDELAIAEIMHNESVNKNTAKLMHDGYDKNVALTMEKYKVDEDTAIEINKIAKVTSSYTGQWVYATLKDGETSLKINQNTLKYLAETAGFKKADDVKAIQINNGNVIPEISDDLKYKFTIEDYSSSYKNVAMRLKENEIRNDTLDKNGIKKLRFDKSKNAIYITMKTNHDTLNLKNRCEDGKTLLSYIEKLTNVDIDSVCVGKNEQDFNSENGNEGIKIIYDEEYAGSITFESGKDVLDTQKQKIEKISTDENGNLTVILKNDTDDTLFEINTDVIKHLQKEAGMVGWFSTAPLKSLTVKKSDGKTNARIRVAQSIKDKYELVDGVLQAKN